MKLTTYQRDVLLPIIISDFRTKYSRFNPITSQKYCEIMTDFGYEICDVTFRKIIKYIQVNGLLKFIVANSDGFFRTQSKKLLQMQIDSLWGREKQIRDVRLAMMKQMGAN